MNNEHANHSTTPSSCCLGGRLFRDGTELASTIPCFLELKLQLKLFIFVDECCSCSTAPRCCSKVSGGVDPASLFSVRFQFQLKMASQRSERPVHTLRPASQQSPQGCPRNSANVCLVEAPGFSFSRSDPSVPLCKRCRGHTTRESLVEVL